VVGLSKIKSVWGESTLRKGTKKKDIARKTRCFKGRLAAGKFWSGRSQLHGINMSQAKKKGKGLKVTENRSREKTEIGQKQQKENEK